MSDPPEAVIFIGIQATGKSTFYKRRFVDSHIRLNLDMLNTRHRETVLFGACLDVRQSFVIDNTNPTPDDRARYIPRSKEARFRVCGYYFSSEPEAALARNAARAKAEQIPKAGVLGTLGKLERPSYDEGFDDLYYVTIEDGEFRVEAWRDND
ncbi:MAG: hypothetical protein U5L04_16125 [Trueperaceae bacterium]|nr:hypothetical protein [Trueperaceae bacterium]